MANLLLVALVQGAKHLERDPFPLGDREKGSGADSVVQAVFYEFADYKASSVSDLEESK